MLWMLHQSAGTLCNIHDCCRQKSDCLSFLLSCMTLFGSSQVILSHPFFELCYVHIRQLRELLSHAVNVYINAKVLYFSSCPNFELSVSCTTVCCTCTVALFWLYLAAVLLFWLLLCIIVADMKNHFGTLCQQIQQGFVA